jgi:hypothetical protein
MESQRPAEFTWRERLKFMEDYDFEIMFRESAFINANDVLARNGG